ncbi:MAG: hypothetical protein IIA72_06520 [Proteobacteria bacterium]|nr:hypothetical protein [Pseudomonadota bacterium]
MKLIGTEYGRTAFLFPTEEMRPLPGLHLPSVVETVVKRYNFFAPPDLTGPWDEVLKRTMTFRSGKLKKGNKHINISEFVIYTDAIAAECTITENAEEFLIDLLSWGQDALGLRESDSNIRRYYTSRLVVEFNKDANRLLAKYDELSSLLSATLNELYEVTQPVELHRLTLNCDRSQLSSFTLATDFWIERRVNVPYSSQRFFCEAPLPTNTHAQLLKRIERLLSSA